MTERSMPPLYAPPGDDTPIWEKGPRITGWQFPNWFVARTSKEDAQANGSIRSRRLVHQKSLQDNGRYGNQPVVPTRFVQACPNGHISDLDWDYFVHRGETACRGRALWMDEQGTGGDLSDIVIRCECGKKRPMREASMLENGLPLGSCRGDRPWLGLNARENCELPLRLLIRTASNAYFPMLVSVLSLPDDGSPVDKVVGELWQDNLREIDSQAVLATVRRVTPQLRDRLEGHTDADVWTAIQQLRGGGAVEKSVKEAELDAILDVPVGYGDDSPIDQNFHARRLPESVWRKSTISDPIESVIQMHRLREVTALTGFTRFEPITPNIHGEYDSDVQPAKIALQPSWYPAVENRGEGIFIQLRKQAVETWMARPEVKKRVAELGQGHEKWLSQRGANQTKDFVDGPYILLHTLSHLVIQSLSMTCGYPASSIKERIYVEGGHYGFLLYTGTPDADGTLGGLVQEARHIERHLADTLSSAALCSNDPICSQHEPGTSLEGRWLHGAACHGCCLVAETSCEMRNDYLDRALVVPILGRRDAAFFPPI